MIGMDIGCLDTPAFLVDIMRVKKNADSMIQRCKALGVILRPHMKTHKTIEGGILMTNGTKRCIVVSTLNEAEFFAKHGFDDILYAQPLIPEKINRYIKLAECLKQFHVMLDQPFALKVLEANPLSDGKIWSVFLKIDCGYGRAGMLWDDQNLIALANQIALQTSGVKLAGIYSHCGLSYDATSKDGILQVGKDYTERMCNVSGRLKAANIDCPVVGIGSTPTCSIQNDALKDLTELHPGNYIFYDVEQKNLGSCSLNEIACKVATRVMGHYPKKNQMLIDLGFTGLTLHGLGKLETGYGVFENEPNLKLLKMSQEVGFVKTVNGEPLDFNKYPIGTLLFIYPFHSCATAGMYSTYYIHDGNKIIEQWTPTRGW